MCSTLVSIVIMCKYCEPCQYVHISTVSLYIQYTTKQTFQCTQPIQLLWALRYAVDTSTVSFDVLWASMCTINKTNVYKLELWLSFRQ